MKHADAFKVRGPKAGERVVPFVIECEFCGVGIMTLHDGRPWRSVQAVVKNHMCPKLRAALDSPPVLVGQTTLSNELGLCNSAYRPIDPGPGPRKGRAGTIILCSGHHPLGAETHSGGGYVWQDTEAENYA